jgi:hypothetical protein
MRLPLGLLFSLVSSATFADSMPAALMGQWCNDITIRNDGYSATIEGEGYGCKLKSIKAQPLANTPTWEAEFVCSGEGSKPASQKSLMQLRVLEGKDLLVFTEESRRHRGIKIARRVCQ